MKIRNISIFSIVEISFERLVIVFSASSFFSGMYDIEAAEDCFKVVHAQQGGQFTLV